MNIRTDANYVEVNGNHNSSLFAPNFYCVDVWMTDDRLEITYSLEGGHRVEVIASITRTVDGYTLVGAHSTFDGSHKDSTYNDEVRGDETAALLRYAGRVDALANEFILPQVLRALVVAELRGLGLTPGA